MSGVTLAEKIQMYKKIKLYKLMPYDSHRHDEALAIINELQADNEKLRGKIDEFIDGERCGPND